MHYRELRSPPTTSQQFLVRPFPPPPGPCPPGQSAPFGPHRDDRPPPLFGRVPKNHRDDRKETWTTGQHGAGTCGELVHDAG